MAILPSVFSVSNFDTQTPILSDRYRYQKNPDTFPILDTDSIEQPYFLPTKNVTKS